MRILIIALWVSISLTYAMLTITKTKEAKTLRRLADIAFFPTLIATLIHFL